MPTVITRSQYLEVRSVPLATPAWRILNLHRLHGLTTRGQDRPLPGGGTYKNPRRPAYRSTTLSLLVMGGRTHEDAAQSNPYEGLDDNIDFLMANVIEPPTGATDTAIWHKANGNVTADLHIESFEPVQWAPAKVWFDMEVSIPDGLWVAA